MDQIIRPQTGTQPASPAEVRLAVQLKQSAFTLGVVAGTVIILSLIALFLNWTKTNRIKSLEQTINTKNQMIETSFGKIVQQQNLIKKQLETLEQAENELIDYRGQLWEELAKKAVKQARITSLALDENSQLTIEGQADTYSDIARQIDSWTKSINLKNVKLESAGRSEQGKKQFSVKMEFKPSQKL